MSPRTLSLLAVLVSLLASGRVPAQLIGTLDYSDTFTLGLNGRANGVCCAPGPYAVEDTHGNPPSTWTPQTNYSFNDIPGSFGAGPVVLAAATGNPGAATGIAQSGGGDFSFAYGLRTNYAVEVDAFVSPGDRTDISSLPSPGDSIFAANSLSVFFRRDSIGANGIGLFNGAVESHVLDAGGNPVRIGVDDDNWHKLAVHFNQDADRLVVYVDGAVKADLDLTTFAGGIYQNYSNGAVGAGGAGAFVAGKVLWFDNFQVGSPEVTTIRACFSVGGGRRISHCPVSFDAGCSASTGGDIVRYDWDFGDASAASGRTVDHAYSAGGTYTVTLTVEDAAGGTASTSQDVVIAPVALSYGDDFERPAGPVDGWTVFAGPTWRLSGTALAAGPTGEENWIWAGAPPVYAPSDATFEYDYTFLAAGSVPAVGRHGGFQFCSDRPTHRGAFSGYFIDWIDRPSDRGVRFTRVDNGGFVEIVRGQGASAPPQPPVHYKVEIAGERIRVFGDGVPYVDLVDDTYRGGFFGFWTWTGSQEVAIDNVTLDGEALGPCWTWSPERPLTGDSVSFDASCSKVFGGGSTIDSYAWDFGDATGAGGAMASHVYAAPDIYTVTLTVTDSLGATASFSRTIPVVESLKPFRECFDGPAGPADGWTQALGNWSIPAAGGVEVDTHTTGGEGFLYAGAPPRVLRGDFVAEVDWDYVLGSHPVVGRHGAVHFFWNVPTTNRFAGDSSGYSVFYIDRTSDRGLTLARWDGAALSVLNPPGGTPSLTEPPRTLRIEVRGSRIQVFGDGVPVIDVTDGTYREGLFALWAWNQNRVRFDDVRIWDPSGPEPDPCGTTYHLAGDCNLDGRRDVSDIVCSIRQVFRGFFLLDRTPPPLPCAGGLTSAGNLVVLDLTGEGAVNVADIVRLAQFLFGGGAPPAQGTGCLPVAPERDCRVNPTCGL